MHIMGAFRAAVWYKAKQRKLVKCEAQLTAKFQALIQGFNNRISRTQVGRPHIPMGAYNVLADEVRAMSLGAHKLECRFSKRDANQTDGLHQHSEAVPNLTRNRLHQLIELGCPLARLITI